MNKDQFQKSNSLNWRDDGRFLKSGDPIGTVRIWSDGKKHQKQADGTWKEINDKNEVKLQVNTKEGQLFDVETVKSDFDTLKSKIKAPEVKITLSTLGGKDNASVMMAISLDKSSDWQNGYIQNSRYMYFKIDKNGTIDQFQRSHKIDKKFIKRKVKSLDDAVSKINSYIADIDTNQIQEKDESHLLNKLEQEIASKEKKLKLWTDRAKQYKNSADFRAGEWYRDAIQNIEKLEDQLSDLEAAYDEMIPGN